MQTYICTRQQGHTVEVGPISRAHEETQKWDVCRRGKNIQWNLQNKTGSTNQEWVYTKKPNKGQINQTMRQSSAQKYSPITSSGCACDINRLRSKNKNNWIKFHKISCFKVQIGVAKTFFLTFYSHHHHDFFLLCSVCFHKIKYISFKKKNLW